MRSVARTFAIGAAAVGLLALFVRNADLPAVWAEIRRAEIGLIVVAIACVFVSMALRTIRWRYLLEPIGATTFGNAFRATMIGFAATSVLPARAGEVIRPYLLARREGFSATSAFATIVIERVLDLLTVVLLLAAFVWWFDTGAARADGAAYAALRAGGVIGGLTAIGLLAVMFGFAGRPEGLGRVAARLERVLPSRVAGGVARLAATFAEGLAGVRDPGRLAASMAWSLPLWLSIGAGIWATSRAFDIDFPFTGSFPIMALLVVGVLVPTPGGIGGFHEAYRIGATAFYAVPNDRAVGAAIVLHAVSVLPVVLVGLLYVAREGFSLRSMQGLARSAVSEDTTREVPVLRSSQR